MEKRFPQIYYIKMKISYHLGFIAIGVAMATKRRHHVFYLSLCFSVPGVFLRNRLKEFVPAIKRCGFKGKGGGGGQENNSGCKRVAIKKFLQVLQ